MRSSAVDVGRAVADQHVHLARGRLDAVAHDRPERARRLAVGDDRDPHAAVGPPARRRRARRAASPGRDDERRLAHDRRARRSRPSSATSSERSAAPRRLMRIAGRSGIARLQPRAAARRAVDRERRRRPPPARSCSPRRPLPRVEVRAAHAVVGDEHDERRRRRGAPRPARRRRLRVPGDVGQRLGHDEVGGRLDRRGQALVDRDLDLDGHRRALGQRGDRGRQAAVGEDRRVDAAGELAQLGRARRPAARRARRPAAPASGRRSRRAAGAARARARRAAAGRRRGGRARSAGARRRPPRRCAGARRAAPPGGRAGRPSAARCRSPATTPRPRRATSSRLVSSAASWTIAATRRPSRSTAVHARPEPGSGSATGRPRSSTKRLAVGQPVGDRHRAVAEALGEHLAHRARRAARGASSARADRAQQRVQRVERGDARAPRPARRAPAARGRRRRRASTGRGSRWSPSAADALRRRAAAATREQASGHEPTPAAPARAAAAAASTATTRHSARSDSTSSERRHGLPVERAAPAAAAGSACRRKRLAARRSIRTSQPARAPRAAEQQRQPDPDDAQRGADHQQRDRDDRQRRRSGTLTDEVARGPGRRARARRVELERGDHRRPSTVTSPRAAQGLDRERRVGGRVDAARRARRPRRSRPRPGSGPAGTTRGPTPVRRAQRQLLRRAAALRGDVAALRRAPAARSRRSPSTSMSPLRVVHARRAAVAAEAHAARCRAHVDRHVVGHDHAVVRPSRRASTASGQRDRSRSSPPATRRWTSASWPKAKRSVRCTSSTARCPPPAITTSASSDVERHAAQRPAHGEGDDPLVARRHARDRRAPPCRRRSATRRPSRRRPNARCALRWSDHPCRHSIGAPSTGDRRRVR